uniref:Redoxin domain-containing protein n=1 Tax=uncultured marine group II/III euryarchaeote KM3_115_A12 TaxID=1457854 RepID=A0A075GD58_9EURY|nr:redoxin domain-containing protein [uncultured marine group II/III euryarchaeote KM3_115_A12]
MSRGLEPGEAALPFELPNANQSVGGSDLALSDVLTDVGAVVMFTCNHCPYVVGSEARIEQIAAKARAAGIGFVGINSNDPVMYQSDDWSHMVKRADTMSYPYLHDASQLIASSWGAERTPEFYLLAGDGTVTYRGRLDNSPDNPNMASTAELSDAIDAMLAGNSPQVTRTESIGCSVKWKA